MKSYDFLTVSSAVCGFDDWPKEICYRAKKKIPTELFRCWSFFLNLYVAKFFCVCVCVCARLCGWIVLDVFLCDASLDSGTLDEHNDIHFYFYSIFRTIFLTLQILVRRFFRCFFKCFAILSENLMSFAIWMFA